MGRAADSSAGGGLLPELIGLIAEYAAGCFLRWSASQRAARMLLSVPLDDEGCSRTVAIVPYRSGEPGHVQGWNGALSDEPLSAFPVDADGRGRWGCSLAFPSAALAAQTVTRDRQPPTCWAAD
jgi:hypothetical protein